MDKERLENYFVRSTGTRA